MSADHIARIREAWNFALLDRVDGVIRHAGIAAVNDALEAAEQSDVTAWQPIETAPKDGTKFLIVRAEEGEEIEICHWCEIERSHFEEIDGGLFRKVQDEPMRFWNGNGHRATHWMPLPAPPEITEATS